MTFFTVVIADRVNVLSIIFLIIWRAANSAFSFHNLVPLLDDGVTIVIFEVIVKAGGVCHELVRK